MPLAHKLSAAVTIASQYKARNLGELEIELIKTLDRFEKEAEDELNVIDSLSSLVKPTYFANMKDVFGYAQKKGLLKKRKGDKSARILSLDAVLRALLQNAKSGLEVEKDGTMDKCRSNDVVQKIRFPVKIAPSVPPPLS